MCPGVRRQEQEWGETRPCPAYCREECCLMVRLSGLSIEMIGSAQGAEVKTSHQ